MATAATLAGLAFADSGLALVHALEYPLGGIVHVTHGAETACFYPHVRAIQFADAEEELMTVTTC